MSEADVAASLAQMIREWMTGPNPLEGTGLEGIIEKRLARLTEREVAERRAEAATPALPDPAIEAPRFNVGDRGDVTPVQRKKHQVRRNGRWCTYYTTA